MFLQFPTRWLLGDKTVGEKSSDISLALLTPFPVRGIHENSHSIKVDVFVFWKMGEKGRGLFPRTCSPKVFLQASASSVSLTTGLGRAWQIERATDDLLVDRGWTSLVSFPSSRVSAKVLGFSNVVENKDCKNEKERIKPSQEEQLWYSDIDWIRLEKRFLLFLWWKSFEMFSKKISSWQMY